MVLDTQRSPPEQAGGRAPARTLTWAPTALVVSRKQKGQRHRLLQGERASCFCFLRVLSITVVIQGHLRKEHAKKTGAVHFIHIYVTPATVRGILWKPYPRYVPRVAALGNLHGFPVKRRLPIWESSSAKFKQQGYPRRYFWEHFCAHCTWQTSSPSLNVHSLCFFKTISLN